MDPIVFSLLFPLSSHTRQLRRLLWVTVTSLSVDTRLQFPPILQELPSDPMFALENCLFVDFLSLSIYNILVSKSSSCSLGSIYRVHTVRKYEKVVVRKFA